MCARQAPIAAALFAGANLLFGCSAVPTQHAATEEEFVSESAKAFTGRNTLKADAGQTTWAETTVELAPDLLDAPPAPARLAIPSAGISATVDAKFDASSRGRGRRGNDHRADVTLRFGRPGEDACESGESVGPIAFTLRNGRAEAAVPRHELDPKVSAVMRGGRFDVCAETSADFDGELELGWIDFEFGDPVPDDRTVTICHIPRGNPDARHTITVGTAALHRHLPHGDYLGPCDGDDDVDDEDGPTDSDADGVADTDDACPQTPAGETVDVDGCSCSQRDGDRDEVSDCDDHCGDTPGGEVVDAFGCSVVMLAADAGSDVTAVEGDIVTLTGTGRVVQGDYDDADLILDWHVSEEGVSSVDVSGTAVTVDTTGVVGAMTLVLTVSTHDGSVSATDEAMLLVEEARIMSVAAGRWHNAVRYENDRARFWGWNRYGQMGDGLVIRDVASVAAGPAHTLLAKTDGTVWTFGENALVDSSVPVQVPDVSNVVQVAATLEGGMMLDADGTVWGFGDGENRFCELGGETYIGSTGVLGPVTIPDLPNNIVSVASGTYHTVALDADGVAWVWGGMRYGCTPFAALDNVVAVEAGDANVVLFIRGDGTAWAMGYNFYGQLGNGTTRSDYNTPTQVLEVADVVAVSAGQYHSMFLQADGSLWAAGWNHDCQLGFTPSSGDRVLVPEPVDLSGVALVAGGNTHSIAVGTNNALWVWGLNGAGQLSGGTSQNLSATVCAPTEITFPGG